MSLYVTAVVNTNYQDDSYVNFDYQVGKFYIPENTPPYTPVRVEITINDGCEKEPIMVTEAWVSHDGKGQTQGYNELYDSLEEIHKYLSDPNPDDYDYLPPEDFDNHVRVDKKRWW